MEGQQLYLATGSPSKACCSPLPSSPSSTVTAAVTGHHVLRGCSNCAGKVQPQESGQLGLQGLPLALPGPALPLPQHC